MPIGNVPITLQLFVVVLMGFLLDKKQIIFILVSYIILGLIGIPIFANGGGFMYLFQPTFGFIIGFIFLALSINIIKPVLLGIIIGYISLYAFGVVWFILISTFILNINVSFGYILVFIWLPFVISDLLSMFISWRISKLLVKRLQSWNNNM